ncbi:hypothetical protein CDAR_540561 [Caerostris darwini]|uniref:Uncharacterized protein n=1 Tax=Caerostris darwini TaxID=1538125 RepID=A0AAV4VMR9_9ARAC|nr:hypothetical protein CDAR_540561 [Caerostris darwini]
MLVLFRSHPRRNQHLSSQGENESDLPHPVNAINIARRRRYLFLPPDMRHPFGIPLHRNLETVDIDYRPQKARRRSITRPEKFPNITNAQMLFQKPASVIAGENQSDHPHPVNAINIARRERYLFLPPGVRHPFRIPLQINLETVDIDYRPQKARPPFITRPEKFPNITNAQLLVLFRSHPRR